VAEYQKEDYNQESLFYSSKDIQGPHWAVLGHNAQNFVERRRPKGVQFEYSEISISYIFPRLLIGRRVLAV